MGMPIQRHFPPDQLADVTIQLASLGLTSKHKRKAVSENKSKWGKYLGRNRNATNTVGESRRP